MKPSDKAKQRFLEELATSGSVSLAAQLSGIERAQAYRMRECAPAFASLWDEALETAIDALEYEARRRAFHGVARPVVSQGRIVKDEDGTPVEIRIYSDALLITLLKAHRPEKYRDRHSIDHSGGIDVTGARERMRALLDRLQGED